MYKVLSKLIGEKYSKELFEYYYIIKFITDFILNYKFDSKKKQFIENDQKKILLGLIPIHGNLGDYALYISAKKMLSDFFPNYKIIDLEIPNTAKNIARIRRTFNKNDDIIILIGGGNMGSRYLTEEFTRQIIFFMFRKYNRVQLPQSSSYENTLKGKLILITAKSIFNHRPDNIILTARDAISYNFFKNNFKCKCLLLPDTVLYLNNIQKNTKENKVLYCLREDKESNLTIQQRVSIINYLKISFPFIEKFDTINTVPNSSNIVEFNKLINKISSSALVITDRLHGVIFSYITNTPVIAIHTYDHKIREFFGWISDSQNCFLAKNLDDIKNNINNNICNIYSENSSKSNEFNKLKNNIKYLANIAT